MLDINSIIFYLVLQLNEFRYQIFLNFEQTISGHGRTEQSNHEYFDYIDDKKVTLYS